MSAVAVTGLGLMVPHGHHNAAVFDALMQGRSALQPVFAELVRPAAAALVDFDPQRWFNKLQLAGVDRVSQLAVAAADLAMADAGAAGQVAPERLGVYAGCGMGGAAALEAAYRAGGNRVPPLTIPAFMPNAPAAHVAMRQQAQGAVLTYSVACASSAVAIAEAARAVRDGELDMAIAGGSESLIVPGVVMAWQAMQTLAPAAPEQATQAVRPFALDRGGFALGEGAAFLVIESAEHARRRGARVHALLAGWGTSCDASHLTKPDAHGQARALRQALQRAGLQPADVGYCNAHGTATRIGDVVERAALAEVWGPALDDLRVSSTKALHGHLLGAAGALEAAITVMALQQQRLPPNAHCREIDPECALSLVPAGGLATAGLNAAISSSFAFGGTNSVLLFTRH
ncbi:beta-ketoacyl-[acyl-carrier-protein] synthase family protein [Aquabacterium sp. OR-4]|uniref:beta-ketoacyl-[acyl-carrier-protein] synthase family protein n=1 Tax=Aquabacterium sp. OR-4 TaxID=2978127 RepID=UPI0021B32885|nr:beta-ketoacyl-[acyl-carrier-protein] synthase family protein [Aquabacterium sp. OR-4]MDT7836751.1 beta-ketoacyl-[acyl-carrier-protein] synthase family protein [Aquabacterium sp. OR-4]